MSSSTTRRFASLASFVTGFSILGAEVAAGRLLAPSFGTSTLVWSSLIGVVLGSLAAGASLGGRWSRRPDALREAFGAAALAGLVLAAVPALTRPILRGAMQHFLAGDLVPLVLGLLAVLAILVAPVTLLGAMSPILVHHATTERATAGQASGRLGALGTLGSLAGTFVCGVVLIPLCGTEVTFRVCGGVTLVVGLVGFLLASRGLSRRVGSPRELAAVVGLGALGLALLASGRASLGRSTVGTVVLEEETAHNFLRVVDDHQYRTLYLDEGYAKQSVIQRDGASYLGGVWGYYAVAPAFTRRAPSRVLVLGLGGGTSARDYAERLPGAEIVAVELDPGVVDVARRYFGLPARVEVHTEDARTFLAHDARQFDLVVVDAFQFPYVPFQLTTREFFDEVHAHLREGGALMINAGRKGNELDVVHAVAWTLQGVFRHVSGVNVPHTTNSILVAADHPLEEGGGAANLHFSDVELETLGALPPLAPWTVPVAARVTLTDDRAPIEWLTNRIILHELGRMARAAQRDHAGSVAERAEGAS